jgi:hypothetical protein
MELDFSEKIKSNASLWENIRKKKERIKRGSNERMRKPGEKGAPTKEQIERAKGKALTPSQKEKFMKLEKEVSMKDFLKKYGQKKGKSIYYATLMKMAQAKDIKLPPDTDFSLNLKHLVEKHMVKDTDEKMPEKKSESMKKDFKPHIMYDPKTGKGYKAKVYEDHIKMKKMGYTHEKPESK